MEISNWLMSRLSFKIAKNLFSVATRTPKLESNITMPFHKLWREQRKTGINIWKVCNPILMLQIHTKQEKGLMKMSYSAETSTRFIQTVPFRNTFQQTDVDKGTQTSVPGNQLSSRRGQQGLLFFLSKKPSVFLTNTSSFVLEGVLRT